MTAETVGPRRRTALSTRAAPAPPATLPAAALTPVIAALTGRPLSVGQLIDRAVGLGLLRHPASGAFANFAPQAASRLLLAGYRLPAFADRGSLAELRAHLIACRDGFALLNLDGTDPGGRMWQLHHLPGEENGDGGVLIAPPGGPLAAARSLPVPHFSQAWETTSRLMIVAARRWADLPASGLTFFGGHRWPDGGYRWHAAGCDTDGEGNVLRA